MKGKEHHLSTRKSTGARLPNIPLNFLLGCSQASLDDYELTCLAKVSDLRKQLQEIWDQLLEAEGLAMLAQWFRESDRSAINAALAIEPDPLTWAKQQIKDRKRSDDELIPLASLPPGAAHLAAAQRYQKRNVAAGKCSLCPSPLDPNSVAFCTKHLTASRMRYKPKGGDDPGSIDFLYQDQTPEQRNGRQPGTLAALAMNREKATRALCAELGIPFESAAVTLKAAKESLLAHMPQLEAGAMPADELFLASLIPSRETGRTALGELLAAGLIQSKGKGIKGDRYLYWKTEAKPKPALSGKTKNQVLLQTLRGEDPADDPDRAKREVASDHAIENAGRHLRGPRG